MNDKGFTTIELILAILIAGIVMGAVGTFLTFNIRGFNTAKNIIDIQYEGQLAMNQLTDIARASDGITEISEMGSVDPNTIDLVNTEITPEQITFIQTERDATGTIITHEYVLVYDRTTDPKNKVIKCDHYESTGGRYIDAGVLGAGPGTLQNSYSYDLANYIDSFEIEARDGSFGTSNILIIKMGFATKRASYELQTEVKYRNKH